jgi:hypothetical protein
MSTYTTPRGAADSEDLTRRAIDAALGARCAPDVHQPAANDE